MIAAALITSVRGVLYRLLELCVSARYLCLLKKRVEGLCFYMKFRVVLLHFNFKLYQNFDTKLLGEICSTAECGVFEKSESWVLNLGRSKLQYLQSVCKSGPPVAIVLWHPLGFFFLLCCNFICLAALCFLTLKHSVIFSMYRNSYPWHTKLSEEAESWINTRLVNGRAQPRAV